LFHPRADLVGAEYDAESLRINVAAADLRVAACQCGGSNAQLGVARHYFQALAIGDKYFRVKIVDFSGKLGLHAGEVRLPHRANAATVGQQGLPEGLSADGADNAHARDYDFR